MMRFMKVGGGILAVLILGAAIFLVPTLWFKPWMVDHFFARTFMTFALARPEMLSQIRVLEPLGLYFHADDLNDYSLAFARGEAKHLNDEFKIFKSYDRRSMSEGTRLSADILEWFMKNNQNANRFMFHDYGVTQLGGIHSSLPDFMINIHSVGTKRDAENYVTRVSKFGTAFDQVLEGLRYREENGIVAPRFILQKVLAESRKIENAAPRENILYLDFKKKVEALSGLDDGGRAVLLSRLEREIVETVQPAYARLNSYVAELELRASDDAGVWKLPDGDAYYTQRLRNFTTTHLSADSIHAIGLAEVDRIKDEMREILRSLELPSWDPIATLNELAEQDRFHYQTLEGVREEIIADYKAIIDDAFERSKALFNMRPESSVDVRRVPEFRETTAPGAYYMRPAMDGSRPGVFYANLVDPSKTVRYRMRTLAYHEAVPGHHFQIAIQQELTGVPFFRKMLPFTAYTEGWALYAERLALEHGYHPDPYDRLGALQAELFRAVRLVVDTGIHRKRWTREQAIDFMLAHSGSGRDRVVREVERYIVWPGQACAYKIGQLKILELRRRAMDELGDHFDLTEFHDVVLGNGSVPLVLLEQVVDRWIGRKRSTIARDAQS